MNWREHLQDDPGLVLPPLRVGDRRREPSYLKKLRFTQGLPLGLPRSPTRRIGELLR